MSDLVQFLLERYKSQEGGARYQYAKYGDASGIWLFSKDGLTYRLADIAAKRRIVELHNPCDDWSYGDTATCPELVALAQPFADYPDFREEWKL